MTSSNNNTNNNTTNTRPSSSSSSTSRWGRRSHRNHHHHSHGERNSYIPPNLDPQRTTTATTNPNPTSTLMNAPTTTANTTTSTTTTPPPKTSSSSVTSGISTLFRRKDGPTTTTTTNSSSKGRRRRRRRRGTGQDDEDDSSLDGISTVSSQLSIGGRASSRLFYSETNDDSDDSYQSRISQKIIQRDIDDNDHDDHHSVSTGMDHHHPKTIVRFRGFSTSLSSLFLDEALVCASMGCFGLVLSNRTEFLLATRDAKRGASKRRKTGNPSKLMGYGLFFTLLLIAITFCIWGFGNGQSDPFVQDYVEGYGDNDDYNSNAQYNYGDDANQQNNDDNVNDDANNNNRRMVQQQQQQYDNVEIILQHHFHVNDALYPLHAYHENVWMPLYDFWSDEWAPREEEEEDEQEDAIRHLEDESSSSSYTSTTTRNIGADIRSALLLAFLLFLGFFGRKRRMRTRYALVRARAQEDFLYYTTQTQVSLKDTREDQFDGACSHTLCGCYPIDPVNTNIPTEEDEEEDAVTMKKSGKKKKRKHADCVSRAFNCFLWSCCGALCKCWFQCLSVCALAQEAREMRLLLPPRFQRVDYITHQPFYEYQKDVNDLRRGWLGKTRRKSGIMPHVYALSRLSRYILIGFSITTVVILLTLLLNPRAAFSYADAIVLLATFVQSFIVLYVVHWIFHKSDLSLDAVIKFFAAGFLIAVPTAFFFEGLVVNIILIASYSLYAILSWLGGDGFSNFVAVNWKIFWIVGELINAYLVAAVTEELCKYYTFRCVEHPDLIFLTGLDRESSDGNAVDGGHITYSYGSHQVQELNRSQSFGGESVQSHRSNATGASRGGFTPSIARTTTEEEFYEDDNDARTYRQKAAAVTTGMISVAVGLACAENFLYVFVLGGAQESDDEHSGDVTEEWIVLLFRSIFPIHALAAAMQSVNMIRKFVECTDHNQHRIGVGRIILPAVILHGTFDAILLSINVFMESSWDRYYEENGGNNDGDGTPYNPVILNLVAWASIIFIMLVGILWYYRENRSQQVRLKLLEEQDKARYEGKTYTMPAISSRSSEVELV